MTKRRAVQVAHAELTALVARHAPSVDELRERVLALRGPVQDASERVAAHAAEALRALTREKGGTYAGDGLTFKVWSMGMSLRASPGVAKLDDDLAAALVAGDEKRGAELRAERLRNAETIATAVAVHAGLNRKLAELRGAAGTAWSEWSSALRAELFAPVDRLRARLHEAEAEASAAYERAVADLG